MHNNNTDFLIKQNNPHCFTAWLKDTQIPVLVCSQHLPVLLWQRLPGHDTITLGCFTHWFLPLPVKTQVSTQVWSLDEHQEKGENKQQTLSQGAPTASQGPTCWFSWFPPQCEEGTTTPSTKVQTHPEIRALYAMISNWWAGQSTRPTILLSRAWCRHFSSHWAQVLKS